MAVAVVERWPSWRRAVSGGSTLRTSFETQGSYLDGGGGGGGVRIIVRGGNH